MLDSSLREWLRAHADALDDGSREAACIVPRLAEAGLFRVGVPAAWGGLGGDTADALRHVAAVAEESLTAAFVFWGQRAFIEYLLHSPNDALRDELLGPLLAGTLGGATGLSNAMKFLSGIEELSVSAERVGTRFRLRGRLPWVTNLRKEGFVVALAVDHGSDEPPSIFAVPQRALGLSRTPDLDLVAMRASDTAALELEGVELDARWQLHAEAPRFLRGVRPAFLSLQCALAIGLARTALRHASEQAGSGRDVLAPLLATCERDLTITERELALGLEGERFTNAPATLFALRLRLTEIALGAVQLELEARGGKAYLRQRCGGFARRWREASFLSVVTPSAVQLRSELARHGARETP